MRFDSVSYDPFQSGPILMSACSKMLRTVGHWSLSRPAVFFIGKEDGSIEVWDLLQNSHEPSQSQNISSAAVTCIKTSSISCKWLVIRVVVLWKQPGVKYKENERTHRGLQEEQSWPPSHHYKCGKSLHFWGSIYLIVSPGPQIQQRLLKRHSSVCTSCES